MNLKIGRSPHATIPINNSNDVVSSGKKISLPVHSTETESGRSSRGVSRCQGTMKPINQIQTMSSNVTNDDHCARQDAKDPLRSRMEGNLMHNRFSFGVTSCILPAAHS